ncbi:MAG: hypothetical protein ACYC9O_16070 [Candidatus Latescibacterota bacterium]
MPKNWSGDDEDFLSDRFDDMMMRAELTGKYEVNVKTVSDKLEHLAQKSEKKRSGRGVTEDPLRKFGYVIRSFILDSIKVLDYRDIADLAGISADDLKEAVEKIGIRMDSEKISRWPDLPFKTFESVAVCARCDVQCRHSSFIVGYTDCKKCFVENVRLWIQQGHLIRISLRNNE